MLWLRKQLPQRHFLFPVLLILLRVADTNVCTMDYMYHMWCIGNSGVIYSQTFRVWEMTETVLSVRIGGCDVQHGNKCGTLFSEQLILSRKKDVW